MNRSENIWSDEMATVKIIIEVTENTDGGCPKSDDILKQAEYCVRGLGYDVNVGVSEQ